MNYDVSEYSNNRPPQPPYKFEIGQLVVAKDSENLSGLVGRVTYRFTSWGSVRSYCDNPPDQSPRKWVSAGPFKWVNCYGVKFGTNDLHDEVTELHFDEEELSRYVEPHDYYEL